MTEARWSRVWIELKPFIGPALVLVSYAILRLIYAGVVGEHGMIESSGSINRVRAGSTLAILLLRVIVLVVVPFTITYRVLMRLARGWIARG